MARTTERRSRVLRGAGAGSSAIPGTATTAARAAVRPAAAPAADLLARAGRLGHRLPAAATVRRDADPRTLRRLLSDLQLDEDLRALEVPDHPGGKPFRYDRVLLLEALDDYAARPLVATLRRLGDEGWATLSQENLLAQVLATGSDELFASLDVRSIKAAVADLQGIRTHVGIVAPTFTPDDLEHERYGPFADAVLRLGRQLQRDRNYLVGLANIQPIVAAYAPLAPGAQAFFLPWITARSVTGDVLEMALFLRGLSPIEIEGSILRYREHRDRETEYEGTEERLVEVRIGKGLLVSELLKDVRKLIDPGLLRDTVVALPEDAFARAHADHFVAKNADLVTSEVDLRIRSNRLVDRIEGFQNDIDGRIYVRRGLISEHIATHESLHKLGGRALGRLLGHHLMEGATEHLAQLICGELSIPFPPDAYPTERKVLLKLMEYAGISLRELVLAYFTDNVSVVRKKMVDVSGEEGLLALSGEKDVGQAFKAWSEEYIKRLGTKKTAPKEESNCFLTTACVAARGLPDDCRELEALRRFRDGWLARAPGGGALIAAYYRSAPEIVARMRRDPAFPRVADDLYRRLVLRSIALVEAGQPEAAVANYRARVEELAARYGVAVEVAVC